MQRWKLIAAGGTAAGVVVLGGGVAYGAATGPSTPAAQVSQQAASAKATQNPNGHQRRPLLRRAVHGTVTVRTKKGFKTIKEQRGTVTAASATRLTVTSPDKVTQTYTMNGATRVRLNKQKSDRSHVAKGQHAFVVTSPKAGPSVAKRVVLRTK